MSTDRTTIRAILLAAGLGTRLAPLTEVLPKCLMPIQGRPLLEYWLRSLDEAGFADVLVNTHYLPELVRDWITGSPWADRTLQAHEPSLLGTGGTLCAQREFSAGHPVLLVHADNLCTADLAAFAEAHRQRAAGTAMTMMCFATDYPQSCGIVALDDQGRVVEFHEKVADPPGNLANAAVYIVEPEVTEFIASLDQPFVDFSTEVIPHFLGRIQAWQNTAYHRDIGNIGSLLAAQEADLPPLAPSTPGGFGSLRSPDGSDLGRAFAAAMARGLKLPLARIGERPQRPAVLLARDDAALEKALCATPALASGSVLILTGPHGPEAATTERLRRQGCEVLTLYSETNACSLEETC